MSDSCNGYDPVGSRRTFPRSVRVGTKIILETFAFGAPAWHSGKTAVADRPGLVSTCVHTHTHSLGAHNPYTKASVDSWQSINLFVPLRCYDHSRAHARTDTHTHTRTLAHAQTHQCPGVIGCLRWDRALG